MELGNEKKVSCIYNARIRISRSLAECALSLIVQVAEQGEQAERDVRDELQHRCGRLEVSYFGVVYICIEQA